MLKSFEELSQGGLNYREFEEVRQSAHAKNKKGLMIGGIAGGVLLLIGVILLAVGSVGPGVGLMIAGGVVFGVYFAIVNSKAKKEVKQKVIGDLIKAIDPTFVYSKGDRNFIPEFRKAGFIKVRSQTSVDDVFLGKMNGSNFSLGEMVIKQKKSRNGRESYITVFQGPFAFAETSNNYGFTSVIPDKMEKSLGGIGKFLQKADISRLNQKNIRIDEDPNFEKEFAVWTKDETTTRQILNPEFRSYLMGLATLSKTYVGWRENKIFFGMDNRRDMFKIKLKNAITQGSVRQFYDDFAQYYNILENVVSFVTTGVGTGGVTNTTNNDVPPPPSNDVPPPPTNDAPPPPPTDNMPPPPPQQ